MSIPSELGHLPVPINFPKPREKPVDPNELRTRDLWAHSQTLSPNATLALGMRCLQLNLTSLYQSRPLNSLKSPPYIPLCLHSCLSYVVYRVCFVCYYCLFVCLQQMYLILTLAVLRHGKTRRHLLRHVLYPYALHHFTLVSKLSRIFLFQVFEKKAIYFWRVRLASSSKNYSSIFVF